MGIEDFKFMTALEPEGCFVAFQGSERIGVATCVSYGQVGWFGNLIVKEKYRGKGVGSLLVKHALNYLKSREVQTVGLYAYPSLARFYGNLGFRLDEEFSVLHVESLGSLIAQALPCVESRMIGEIEAFDRRCFGGDRRKLLESIILEKDNLWYYLTEEAAVAGYVAALVSKAMAWVGPLICKKDDFDGAVKLLKAVLAGLSGRTVYIVLPKKETLLANMLSGVGFREDFSVSRMFLGEAVAKNCIYAAESLERG